MPRKTPQELHAHHAALAEKHRVAALMAQDPILRDADDLRDRLDAEGDLSDDERDLHAALTAFIDGRCKA